MYSSKFLVLFTLLALIAGAFASPCTPGDGHKYEEAPAVVQQHQPIASVAPSPAQVLNQPQVVKVASLVSTAPQTPDASAHIKHKDVDGPHNDAVETSARFTGKNLRFCCGRCDNCCGGCDNCCGGCGGCGGWGDCQQCSGGYSGCGWCGGCCQRPCCGDGCGGYGGGEYYEGYGGYDRYGGGDYGGYGRYGRYSDNCRYGRYSGNRRYGRYSGNRRY